MKINDKSYNIADLAYEKSIYSLKKSFSPYGLFASGGKNGYKGVWSRDSFITFLGASLVDEDKNEFREQFRKSLEILGKYQSKKGQIPNAVHTFGVGNQKPVVDFSSIDSTLWFIIGHFNFKERYNDSSLINKHKKNIKNALSWLEYQDVGEDVMLEQHPTTDWQDAFPHKYGKTINTQSLYYRVLKLVGERKKAKALKNAVNKDFHGLWEKNFYLAYKWKVHGKYKETGNWFDSLGNLLAILFDLAEEGRAQKIISHIKKNHINEPYPIKAIYPPIKKGSKYWKNYYLDSDAGKPYHYLNAGIWPFIGGFYVLALIKLKKIREAKKDLDRLAESNLKGNLFPEWINPINKRTHGIFQSWDAGTYILAYESLKRRNVLL